MNRDEMVLKRPTVGESTARGDGMWVNARSIARIELSRAWPSYLIAAISTPFIGLLALALLWLGLDQASSIDGLPAMLPADYIFLLALVNLGVNWTSLRWFYVYRDPFTVWYSFLKTLPISTRDLVLGRSMVLLATTAVMALLFFLPTYALFPALRQELPPAQYLWFALFWVGYALFSGGILLYLEMGVRGKATFVLLLTWTALLVSVAILVAVLGSSLTAGSIGLIEAYGILPAVVSLAIGGGTLYVWCRLLMRRLKTRDLSA